MPGPSGTAIRPGWDAVQVVGDARWVRLLQRHAPAGLGVLAAPEAPGAGPVLCVHDSEEGVEQCLASLEGLVLWPAPEGVVLSPFLATEELRHLARRFFREQLESRGARPRPSLGTLLAHHPFLEEALGALIGAELHSLREGAVPDRFSVLQPGALRVRRHELGGLASGAGEPPVAGSPGRLVFQPRTETEEGSGRAPGAFRRVAELPHELTGTPFSLVPRPLQRMLKVNTLAMSGVTLVAGGHSDMALGRALDFQQAELATVFEALERRCSYFERQLPVIRDSFSQLVERQPVVDPRALLLPPAQEAPPTSKLVPFEPSLELDWVHGHSLRHGVPILVPARSVFIGYREDRLLLEESSNGCALGGSLEEASLHALLELIERDAFLMTWYARRPVVRLELEAVADRRIHLLCDRAGHMGYEIRAYRTTVDAPVPSVWVQAVARGGTGPRTLSSAGAHLTPERALLSGLVEVIGSLTLMGPQFDAERGRICLADPAQVRTSMDHFHLFGLPEQAAQLSFLEEGGRGTLQEAFAGEAFMGRGRELTAKLEALVRRLLEQHPDVILVDLTHPRMARQGLHCVRAIVPGMLPMTFGHRNRRVHGCERLERLRARRGPSNEGGETYPPHPFP